MLTKTIGNTEYKLVIQTDEYSESPRKWDNLGTLVTANNNYMGDEELPHNSKDIDDAFDIHLESKGLTLDNVYYLKVWLMDHSGISISTKPFGCSWDSGQWGFIYVDINNQEIIDDKLPEDKVLDILNNEIKELNKYYHGEIYEYIIESRKILNQDGYVYRTDWDNLESCGGYYSLELIADDIIIEPSIFSKEDILNYNV